MTILAWMKDKKNKAILNTPEYSSQSSLSWCFTQKEAASNKAANFLNLSKRRALWTRCEKCGMIQFMRFFKENANLCLGCAYHHIMTSDERIELLVENGTWYPLNETMSPKDPLSFTDTKPYTQRIQSTQEKLGIQDAVQTGTGLINGIPFAIGIMDFRFMGGSMGSVVGEKLTRLIEYATKQGLFLLIVSASGGARMQEGIYSLMQMAKISAALNVYQNEANLLYISLCTSPTTGGVTASFAMLGDIIFSEPEAIIGFAGRRVIQQTLQQELPEDFQTSESLLQHGLIDAIVPRFFLVNAISEVASIFAYAPSKYKKLANISHYHENALSWTTEELLRRNCINNKKIEYLTIEKIYQTTLYKESFFRLNKLISKLKPEINFTNKIKKQENAFNNSSYYENYYDVMLHNYNIGTNSLNLLFNEESEFCKYFPFNIDHIKKENRLKYNFITDNSNDFIRTKKVKDFSIMLIGD